MKRKEENKKNTSFEKNGCFIYEWDLNRLTLSVWRLDR